MIEGQHFVDRSVCPHCGTIHEKATGMNTDQRPQAGDVTICWECGKVAFFTEDGRRRMPTDDEYRTKILGDQRVLAALAYWRRTKKR